MFARTKRWLPATGVATAALAGVLLPGSAAKAAPSAVNSTSSTVSYDCRTTVRQGFHPVAYSRDFSVQAPARVARKTEFDVVFDPAPITAFAQYNKTVVDVQVAYKLPKNAKLKSYALSGGANLGTAFTWVEVRDQEIVVRSSGPFRGGVQFDLPTLTVHLKAPRNPGDIVFGPGGSSYERPGFFWFRYQPILDEWGPFQCFPDPAHPVEFAKTHVA